MTDTEPVEPGTAAATDRPARKLLGRIPDDRLRFATVLLFTVGAVLMPLGVFAVGYGWYGAATTKYAYDQFPYLLSGGLIGVCLTVIGGFLYFGAWVAKGQADQRDAARQLHRQLEDLPDRLARRLAAVLESGPGQADPGADLVVAGAQGASVHRRDCRLVEGRADLRAVTAPDTDLPPCRVCRPVLP